MTFLANPHFILQISHAKTFKRKYTRCPYNNIIQNIHKVTKTDYVWFEFLWIRRYFDLVMVGSGSYKSKNGSDLSPKYKFKTVVVTILFDISWSQLLLWNLNHKCEQNPIQNSDCNSSKNFSHFSVVKIAKNEIASSEIILPQFALSCL